MPEVLRARNVSSRSGMNAARRSRYSTRQRFFQGLRIKWFRRIAWTAFMKVLILLAAWCILFVLCWPLALLALIVAPLVWLILLPFRREFRIDKRSHLLDPEVSQ